MSDTAASGSATTLETSNAGIPAAAAGGADQGSNGAAADPFAGLQDAGIREWVGKAGVKDVESLAKKARDAESLIGRSIQLPGADAKPEDWDKVYARLGRPEKADGYEFKLPDGLPKEFAYDAERANAFKAWAHAAGLTPKQAQALHDAEIKANAEAFSKLQATVTENAVKATAALEKAYGGAKDSDAFKQGVNLAVRAIEGLDKLPGVGGGLMKALEGAGLLMGGVVMEPTIAVALTAIGKAMFAEDKLVTGNAAADGGENPFAGQNLTLQMQMIRTDPDKARRLISVLGKKPEDFGWSGAAVTAAR